MKKFLKHKWFILAIVCLALSSVIGCKDATIAQYKSLGSPHRITVYSGGKAVKIYESTGNVSNQEQSDGWYFEDKTTGKLVEVTGTLTIEQE